MFCFSPNPRFLSRRACQPAWFCFPRPSRERLSNVWTSVGGHRWDAALSASGGWKPETLLNTLQGTARLSPENALAQRLVVLRRRGQPWPKRINSKIKEPWLGWWECHPINQKVTSSITGQGTCLGCGFSPWSGRVLRGNQMTILSLSSPISLKSISMSSGEGKK